MYTAVLDKTTRQLIRSGYTDHLKSGDIDLDTQEQVDLHLGQVRVPDVPMEHQTVIQTDIGGVVKGVFAELTGPEKDAIDAAQELDDTAALKGHLRIDRFVPNTGALPVPPKPGILVGVVDGGSGKPALAISRVNDWAIFDADRIIDP